MSEAAERFARRCLRCPYTDLVPTDYHKLVAYGGRTFRIIDWCHDLLFPVVAAALQHGTVVQLPVVGLRKLIDTTPGNYPLVPIKANVNLLQKFANRRVR